MRVIDTYIVPTPVGVNRGALRALVRASDCPHARGGEPTLMACRLGVSLLSPRPWG